MIEEFEYLSARNRADLRIAMKQATNLSYMKIEEILGTRDLADVQEAQKYIRQCFVDIRHPESGNYGT